MSDTTFDRIAAAGGAAFAVLALSTVAVAPAPPDVDANAGEVRRYLADNHDRIGVSIVLMALAVLALGLFFGYVHRRLVDTDRGSSLPACFLIAGATTVALALAGVLAQGVLVQHTGAGIDDSASARAPSNVASRRLHGPTAVRLHRHGARRCPDAAVRHLPALAGWCRAGGSSRRPRDRAGRPGLDCPCAGGNRLRQLPSRLRVVRRHVGARLGQRGHRQDRRPTGASPLTTAGVDVRVWSRRVGGARTIASSGRTRPRRGRSTCPVVGPRRRARRGDEDQAA